MEKTQATKEKVDIKAAEIDPDVLGELGRDCVLKVIDNEKEMRRAELNCLCEMLSQLNHLHIALDEMLNILSIAGNDKIVEFFSAVRENMEKEEAAAIAVRTVTAFLTRYNPLERVLFVCFDEETAAIYRRLLASYP